jgi:hypothetical protein
VTADRHVYGNNKTETLEELQKRTVQHAEKKHKYVAFCYGLFYYEEACANCIANSRHGTSQDPGM